MHRLWGGGRCARPVAVVSFVAFVVYLFCQAGSSAEQYWPIQPSSLRGNPLVVPSGSLLFEDQQAMAQAAARANPQAVFAREVSREAYARLGREGIARLLAASFPQVVSQPAGGIADVPSGTRIRGYAGTHAIAVTLPGGRPGIVESTQPLAAYTHGRLRPIDLSLVRTAGEYAATNPGVSVRIPSRLGAGVGMPADGVTLTPVDARGRALQSRGSIVHSAVVYPDVQPSTDTVVKPSVDGFQLDAVLRSVASPEAMRYRVGAPAGSRLTFDRRSGAVRVVRGHSTLATILPPGAVDAAGNSVPASMALSGDTLVVTASHRAGSYLYPIDVDPSVLDEEEAEIHRESESPNSLNKGNWEFKSSNEARFGHNAVYEGGKGRLEGYGKASYEEREFGYWAYETQGNSQIYELKVQTSAKNRGNHIESYLELEHSKTLENRVPLSNESLEPEYSGKPSTICPLNTKSEPNCSAGAAAANKNTVRFEQQASKASGSSYGFSDTMTNAEVSISEASGEHSTTSFNTSSPEIEVEVEEGGKKVLQKRTNALLSGKTTWLTKFQGAVQMIAKDAGIGVAATRLEYETAGVWKILFEHHYFSTKLEENFCQGVQCKPEDREAWTVNPEVPDGEDKIRYRAEEAISGTVSPVSEGTATVKIDTKAPHGIVLNGLPYGNELSEKAYTLSATAIDGEGTTVASSGVRKIALFMDSPSKGKQEIAEVGKQTGCTVAKGECTAKAEWSINGAELGAGHHAITIVATDNAGNESKPLEETVSIRHSTPVALGPGSVDLESGDFALGSTDVSQGSGLTVSRNYSSRATLAGIEGPLGPQWSISLGNSESLTEMIDGSILLTSSDGKQSIFASVAEGKFESPIGDSNLKLELEENKTTKEKLAYYLKDPAAGTSDKFTLPAGSKVWLPTKQEGTVATDTVTYTYKSVTHQEEFPTSSNESAPSGVTVGSDGNIWYVDSHNNEIGKMSPTGAVLAEYATQPREAGEARVPGASIISGSDGNIWFLEGGGTVSSKWNVVKMSTSGVQTVYRIGAEAAYMTAGPSGNMWFTEPTAKKIGEMTPSGAVTQYTVSKGEPYSITYGPDGNLWFTTISPYRVEKMSPAGVVIGEYTPTTTFVGWEDQSIIAGPDGNVWFAESGGVGGKGAIAKITPSSGTITPYTVTGEGVGALMTGPEKNIWFSQGGEPNELGKITTEGVITEYGLEKANKMVTGPEGDVWYTDGWHKTIDRTTPTTKINEPTEVLAPVPAGVSCSPTLKAGCRALQFYYEGPASRLKSISLDAYEPSLKEVRSRTVASYGYDSRGELVEEWGDSELKVRYGYDSEGHVTALTPPGQETWAFTYGTGSGDMGTGRLLKMTRPQASETVWTGGEAPKNIELPKIAGAVYPGMRMTVSDGAWSGNPLVYGYQWEDCEVSTERCTPIVGATSANYTVTSADIGRKLSVLVLATNGGGTTTATTASTVEVTARITEDCCVAMTEPRGTTGGPDGKLWTVTASGIRKRPLSGVSTEYSLPTGSLPWEIVTGPDGNLWFTEKGTSKIGKITTGGSITEYALPAGSAPEGITAGPDGNLWFTENSTKKVGKITTSGVITEYSLGGPPTRQPAGITSGPDGNLWIVTEGGSRVLKVTTSGAVTIYTLPEGSDPTGIVTGPDGNLWFTEYGTNRIGKITTTGSITEYPLSAGSNPYGIAAGPDGYLWFTDYGTSVIGRITTAGAIFEYPVTAGSQPLSITKGSDGNMWFSEFHTGHSGKVTIGGAEGSMRTPARAWMMEYGTALTGGSGLLNMTAPEVAKWGQTDDPVEATAIIPPDADQGWPASSYQRATVYYLDTAGRTVNVAKPSQAPYGSVSTTEYNEYNDLVRTLTPSNRQTALEAGVKSVEVSKLLDTVNTYNGEGAHEAEVEEPGTQLIDVIGPQHIVKYMEGSEQRESLARLHTKYFYDEGAPGGTYDLVTKETTLAQLANEEEREVRKTTKSYSGQGGLGWKLRAPTSVTVDPEGKNLTTTTVYNPSTGQIVETRSPAGAAGSNAHDQVNVYYSAEANTEGYAACGGHAEWAGLLCETLPKKQPASGGLPQLPVTMVTSYNVWNEPLVITETFGSTVRTKKNTYGWYNTEWLSSSETTSSAGTPLPKVELEYNSATGALEKRRITVEGKTKTTIEKSNTLGQIVEYTDADGNIATYHYGGLEKDYLLEEVADGSSGGTGKQMYSYNSTTKALEELTDSSAGVFKATYDADGALESMVYPNSMCANYSRNSVGEVTHLEYIKTATCSEHSAPVWFSETRTPSVRGETLARSSTLANETYGYDSVGRLTEAQETPAGQGCTTRLYAYDEESNRLSLTTRPPDSEGKCTTSGGTVQNHTYDEGNRLTDAGVAYDAFGNITALPVADSEGHELTSTFYVSNAVASQSQNGVTINYALDPEGRVREAVSGASATIDHYDGPGETVAWTSEAGGSSTRNIPGIDGALAATQKGSEAPVLQLHDIEGDVVATAALSPTETKLLSTYNSTEFGVPNGGKAPPKFAWLGASDIASAFSTGVITYGATSYVPQTGRALQSEAVEPPGAPDGTGGGAAYSHQEEPWVFQGAAAAAAEAAMRSAVAAGGIDPNRWFTQKQAVEVGEKLNAIKDWGEVWGAAFTVLGLTDPIGAVIGATVAIFTSEEMEHWLHNTGGKLEQCGKNRERWVEGCELSFESLPGGVIDFYSTSEVDKCGTYFWYAKKIFAKMAWECRRLNEKPGPV